MNFLVMMPATLMQALLVIPLDGRPVRFGVPLPAAVVAAGLGLDGDGVLQWRRLPIGGDDADPVWIELAIVGPPGQVRLVPGAIGPCASERGPAFAHEVEERTMPCGREHVDRWRWRDGTVDVRTRTEFTRDTVIGGETFTVGEWLTTESGLEQRAAVILRLPRFGERAGALPPRVGGGATTRHVRAHLQRVLPHLRKAPGLRGAGDFVRSGEVVTNLEFDSTLALVRAALGLGSVDAWSMARRAVQHSRDRDFDSGTGLPFPHGLQHRTGTPEPGHAWLQGMLWLGLLAADDAHIVAARNLAVAIAASPPCGQGAGERLRDHAWPLLELEALLAVHADPLLGRAADNLAISINLRFDASKRTFCFGEGAVAPGVHFERGWLTAGVLVPALRAHLRRRPDRQLAEHVESVQQALLERFGRGGPGLPTHWRIAGPTVFAEHRQSGTAEAALLLEGLAVEDLRRLLGRKCVADAVEEAPFADDPDLPTQFTMLARCEWVWR